ncbi:ABC1-domain-containing protein [Ramaria rubella]|nr:ABC1-domain-containing protein [Ramaria rubella]
MRSNDLYNWYCVFHSVATILRHAAERRIGQTPVTSYVSIHNKRRRVDGVSVPIPNDHGYKEGTPVQSEIRGVPKPGTLNQESVLSSHSRPQLSVAPHQNIFKPTLGATSSGRLNSENISERYFSKPLLTPVNNNTLDSTGDTSTPLLSPFLFDSSIPDVIPAQSVEGSEVRTHREPAIEQVHVSEQPPIPPPPAVTSFVGPALTSSKVPSSRIGRLFHYGGLAASLSVGAASEIIRRSRNDTTGGKSGSLLMTEANLNRLVSKLSQMRGAALKMGQFMSIQDTHVLPEDLERVFRRVQDSAHYMPNWQMENVMSKALGPSWRSHFSSFDPIPSHSASIGQVHFAVLAASSSKTGKEEEVAIKIQFPDIARSISSDLGYLKLLLGASAILPKGLFLDSTIKVFKEELADECDYRREAEFIRKYRNMDPIRSDSRYKVPWVWDDSTEQVLVMERMGGVSVGGDFVHTISQEDRDEIASRIIELCLRELFQFRMMQTDPNWTNFLWNPHTRQIELIDFGATRAYPEEFTDAWLRLLTAAIEADREACIEWSLKLKYFIGGENEAMINAHLASMQLIGTPFRRSTPQPFSFARGSEWTRITDEIRAQIPIMLTNRLTPPPRETYSLNRKLSGAFLLAGRLDANVDCRHLWEKVIGQNASSSL